EPIDELVRTVQKDVARASALLREQGEVQAEKSWQTKARALAECVLDPLLAIEDAKSAQQWVLGLDGDLWLVPWAALPMADGRYLVEQSRLRLVTVGRDVAPAAKGDDARAVEAPAIVADPDFDLPRAAAGGPAKSPASSATPEQRTRGLLSD